MPAQVSSSSSNHGSKLRGPSQNSPLTNTYVITDVLFHDVSGCIGHNGAATSITILSLPGPSKPIADEQIEEVRAVLENDSRTTSSLIEDFPKTTASQDF
ncbi:hypothetical protein AVEN_181298-1 [Araneus ventricosus]|uniref:Uncharacterized protein n=1 Tax=Araneus ventricosus TaxID=182803 RepID=A0A4Y2EK16_ARAVE|nr:hypothetical protein AVEN_181298-1 [Araneus ventricosus]